MRIDDENENQWDDQSGDEGGGTGGIGGKIHFRYRDAASLPPRDDALPPHEIKRLLQVHSELHKSRVDKQKITRKERDALKQGKLHLLTASQQAHALGRGSGGGSNYKKHPISNRAQFSGMEKPITGLPPDFESEANPEMRNELQNRFQMRNAPKFNPQPRPRGG